MLIEIVKKYVSDAKEAIDNTMFGESYNHERVNMEQSYEDGYGEGIEKAKIEMIKKMFSKGATIDFISECANISIDKVKQILDITDN